MTHFFANWPPCGAGPGLRLRLIAPSFVSLFSLQALSINKTHPNKTVSKNTIVEKETVSKNTIVEKETVSLKNTDFAYTGLTLAFIVLIFCGTFSFLLSLFFFFYLFFLSYLLVEIHFQPLLLVFFYAIVILNLHTVLLYFCQ